MDVNPIPYSAFFTKDNSIEELIKSLNAVAESYGKVLNLVKSDAASFKQTVSDTHASTSQSSKSLDDMSVAADRLKRLQRELRIAMSETGQEITRYRTLISEANNANKNISVSNSSASDSVRDLKARLSELVKEYERLDGASRVNSVQSEALTSQILATKRAIKEASDAIKLSTQSNKDEATTKNTLAKAVEGLVAAYKAEVAEIQKIKRETSEVLKIKRLEGVVADNNALSYNRLAAEYELNVINLNKYSQEVISSSKFLKRQQEETAKIRFEMMRLKEATGNHTLSVGNYTKAWNGLGVATQQIVRELPSLAVSLNTFFLAISNNVPIFVDEVQNLINKNKIAASQGLQTVSVWKEVGKSLMSFNSLLVVGLTVLSMSGKAIFNWVGNLFRGEKGLKSLRDMMREVNKEIGEGSKQYGSQMRIYREMQEAWKRAGSSIEDQNKFLADNKDNFRTLGIAINDAVDAQNALVTNAPVVIEALKLMAKAGAAARLSEEKFMEVLVAERERTEKQPEDFKSKAQTYRMFTAPGPGATAETSEVYWEATTPKGLWEEDQKKRQDKIDILNKEAEAYFDIEQAAKLAAKAELEAAGIKPWEPETKEAKGAKQPKGQRQISIESANLAIEKQYAQSQADLERDYYKNRLAVLTNAYDAEVAELRNKQQNEERLTDKSRVLINEIIINKQKKLAYDISMLDIEEQQRKLNFEKESIDLQLSLAEQGTQEYFRLRLALLQNQTNYELLENKKRVEAEQIDEQAIRSKYAYQIIQNEVKLDDILFKMYQEYLESEFDLVKRSEYEKTKFKLEQERTRWQRTLEMAKSGLLQMTDLEIATTENIIKAIDRELRENELSRDIFDMIGLSLNRSQKSAIAEGTSFVKDQIASILDAEVELAEIKLQQASEAKDKAFDMLKLEMEARNDGYANSVDTAAKEYKLAQEREMKATQLKEEAVRARNALDLIEQTSSLITASANIWKSFSPLGPIGVGAAIAAITTMFGSFIAAKIKANQVSTARVEKYEKGHVELLEGGSHSSGDDIHLGMRGQTERRAEGGEVLAVISKKRTNQYGKKRVFDIINSLNDGIFEDKYTNVFNPSVVSTTGLSFDFSSMDRNIKAMRDNTDYKYYKDNKGLLVEKYKNRTRVFR